MRPRRRSFREKVGARSFVFWMVLLCWSVVMGGIASLLLFGGVVGNREPTEAQLRRMSLPEQAEVVERRAARMMHPGAARDADGVGILSSIMCPASIWILVALPLFIAAVVTMEKREPVRE